MIASDASPPEEIRRAPCCRRALRPSSAARPAITTAYGCDPADATHRAVNADTLSSWSAQRMSAARISSSPPRANAPAAGERGVDRWSARDAWSLPRRRGDPECATRTARRRLGRRSNASGSCRRREREHRLRAHDERTVFDPARAVRRRDVRDSHRRGGPSRRATPPPRPIAVAGQGDRVVAAVVQRVVGDQRDRRLEHRHPPMQRVRGHLVGIAPLLGAPSQPVDVVARIAPFARRPGPGLRADEAAADIGVERRPIHAQRARRLGGVQPEICLSY